MEVIFYIIVFVVVSALIMIGTNILYDFFGATIPIIAIIMVASGIVVGFVVAVKNTFSVYKEVYFKKGK